MHKLNEKFPFLPNNDFPTFACSEQVSFSKTFCRTNYFGTPFFSSSHFTKTGFEKYILGSAKPSKNRKIRTKKLTVTRLNDISPQQYRFENDLEENVDEKISVQVCINPNGLGEDSSSRTEFKIKILTRPDSWENSEISEVVRKAKHLYWLIKHIEKTYPFIIIPPLPNFKEINATAKLQRWFDYFLAHPIIRNNETMEAFFTTESQKTLQAWMVSETKFFEYFEKSLLNIFVDPAAYTTRQIGEEVKDLRDRIDNLRYGYLNLFANIESMMEIQLHGLKCDRQANDTVHKSLDRIIQTLEKHQVSGSGRVEIF